MDHKTRNYWNSKGLYQGLYNRLAKLIPDEGRVPGTKPALEKLRRASNAYHDIYNNGGGNRDSAIRSIFGLAPHQTRGAGDALFTKTEPVMDAIILAAAEEQGLLSDEPINLLKFSAAELPLLIELLDNAAEEARRTAVNSPEVEARFKRREQNASALAARLREIKI